MRYLLVIPFALSLFSCSSSNEQQKIPDRKQAVEQKSSIKEEKRYKSQVIIQGEDGVSRTANLGKGSEKTIFDPVTKKVVKSGGWIDINDNDRPGKYLQEKSIQQLILLSQNASQREATMIIDELLVRKKSSVPALIHFLDDDRSASFMKGKEYWWYEKKNQSPEIIQINTYAAFAIQQKVSERPKNVQINLTKDRMFYAIKDGYAVVKEDLIKVWKEWWGYAKNDY